jgi:alpha-glucosidase
MCGFSLFEDGPFGFSFSDDRTGETVLTTKDGAFIMQNKYMQLDMKLPSRKIFGLGERNTGFRLGEGTWTMWANGQETPVDDGSGGLQTYGVHPFMMVETKTPGEYFGVYFRQSNAMSPVIQYKEDDTIFSFITTGGQMEMYFMFKGGPKQILQQYQNIVGKPTLTPLWSLGWHASSYAYINQAMVQANIDGYAANKMPLEGVWLDINYMEDHADFSVNKTAFPDLKTLTDTIHMNNQRMIPIIDAGLSSMDNTNKYYAQAASKGALIKSTINADKQGGFLTQHVWQNHTVFLDFFSEDAKDIWAMGM